MKWLTLCLIALAFSITSCKSQTETKATVSNDSFLTDISLEEAAEKISNGDAIFIDVRTPQEVSDGSIPGSVHIDINSSTFETELEKLDKDKEYVVYCRSGGRSARACKKMQDMGFTKLNNMAAGYSKWNKE